MKRNTASQVVVAQLINKADGTPCTSGTTTCYVLGNGGTQAAGSVGSGACTHEGNGLWSYAPAQAETDYDHVAFTFVNTAAVNATVQIYPSFPQTGDAFARLGAPAGASLSADVAAVKVQTAAIETDTQDLQSRTPAALVSGRMDASVGAMAANVLTATAINADAITAAKLAADVTAELQAGLATAAALATAQTDLDDIQTRLPATLVGGRIDASVGAVAAGAITASGIANDAITAAKIADGAIDAATFAAGAINAAAIAADAITDAKVASDVTIASVTGSVGSVTGNVGGNVVGTVASVVGNVGGNVVGNVNGSVASVGAGGITAASLAADTITASKVAADVTAEFQAGLATTAGVAAVQADVDDIQTRLPAALVSGRMDASVGAMAANVMTAAAAASDLTAELQSGLATASAVAALPTASAVADEVETRTLDANVVEWRGTEPGNVDGNGFVPANLASMNGNTGRVGKLADAMDADTLAKIDDTLEDDGGTYRFTASALAEAPTGGSAPTAVAIANEVQTRTIAAVTVVGSVTGNVGGNVTGSVGSLAAQAKVDVNAEADAALLDAGYTAARALKLDALDANVSTRLATAGYTAPDNAGIATAVAGASAIYARTDVATSTRAAAADVPTAAQNADKLLGRSMAGGSDGGRTVRDGMRTLRNRVVIENDAITVYAEDDVTVAWMGVAVRAPGDPLVEINPA